MSQETFNSILLIAKTIIIFDFLAIISVGVATLIWLAVSIMRDDEEKMKHGEKRARADEKKIQTDHQDLL